MKNMDGCRFFLVEEGSEAHRIISCWQDRMDDYRTHCMGLKERHGISQLWETNSAFSGRHVSGVAFADGFIPSGWRHLKKHPDGMLTPENGKKGDEARRLMTALAMPSRKPVHQAIGYTDGFTISSDMNSVSSAGFMVHAGKIVAHVPKNCNGYEPHPGLKELRMSELYALIELLDEEATA